MFSDLMMRVRALFQRDAVESEMNDELRFHFDAAVAKHVAAGESRAEAVRRARIEFGGGDAVREEIREARGVYFLETLGSDLRFALRMLRKSPGYAAIAILTLALGIGANTAMFSFVSAWIIKPIPFPQPDQLMFMRTVNTKNGSTSWGISAADFVDLQRDNKSFEAMVPWSSWDYNLTGDGRPDRVQGGLVGWNYFQTLGATPMMGRTFLPEDGDPKSSHVAIISRGLWETRYAADPQIVGRKIKVDAETYTVVGVMPATFQFTMMGIANLWTPIALDDQARNDRDTSWLDGFARLKPGVTREQANAELATISARLTKQYPKSDTSQETQVIPLAQQIGENQGNTQVLICFWIVGMVLLIACANVANLMLARASGRAKEFALRGALGASRMRLVRQLLTESALLFAAGGAAGTLVAIWILNWMQASFPDKIRGYLVNYGRVNLDVTTLIYTFAIALLCGVVFGLAPAFQSSGLDVNRALKEASGQTSGSGKVARTRRVFVAAEIALAVVVFISTVLLAQSFAHMTLDDMGFQSSNVISAQLVTPKTKYTDDASIRNFYAQAVDRIGSLPGVTSAAASESIPYGQNNQTKVIHVAGRPPAEPGEEIGAEYTGVTPAYFSTLRIPLLRGRTIEASDGEIAPRVVVINETLLKQQFQNQDPIGQRLEIGTDGTVATIVGVVHDVKKYSISTHSARQIYVSAAQFPAAFMTIVARTERTDPATATAMRDAILSIDSEEPITKARTLDELIYEQNTGYRILTEIIGFFGVLAMLLGAIGIYGVMANAVQQRVHEIGIRMALGATPGEVVRMMVRWGMVLAGTGLGIGLLAAAAATRGMGALLYKVRANDPVTFIGVALFFALIALIACYVPARRGANVDPMIALRCE